jgi:PPM family protein phosphatase
MSSNAPDPRPPQPRSLQSMLARLRGMVQALKSPEPTDAPATDLVPTWDEAAARPQEVPPPAIPVAVRVLELGETAPEASLGEVEAPAAPAAPVPEADTDTVGAEPPTSVERTCPHCQAPRPDGQAYCANCGWIFPPEEETAASTTPGSPGRLRGRYELGERLGERGPVIRYRGLDFDGSADGVPVILLKGPAAAPLEATPCDEMAGAEAQPAADAEPAGASPAPVAVETVPVDPSWPGVAWERALLDRLGDPVFPRVVDQFSEGGYEYLVEECPGGQPLWDAWDDPESTAPQRFGWLQQLARTLRRLHEQGALLEALRPDIVVVTSAGQVRLTDISDLLPLPLPPNPPIRATYYTAPELVLSSDKADARADLYSFGALLYALHLGRELTDLDFELHGVPKSLIQRFPDVHPLFARLVAKTFCRDPAARFPTDEAAADDSTGFAELLRTLEQCGRTLDRVRLEVAAWTTTGMVRSGNEDAFAVLWAGESFEDTLRDAALVLLADGMGGYEAGEVAAALAVRTLREHLLRQAPFAGLAGSAGLHEDADVARCKALLAEALREANRQVYAAARDGASRRTMGCTVEVVYTDGRNVVVGHVGDSRSYHLHGGEVVQLTRDQTWVNRMVDLGALSAQEAEAHPRRSELHQAIGGHAEVEPALYHARLAPGDWIVVCSDGLSNHVAAEVLRDMLLSTASAEGAARRLVNYVNLQGATDNATVLVIRAT